MTDVGLTHIALPVSDVDRTIEFYSKYACHASSSPPHRCRNPIALVLL